MDAKVLRRELEESDPQQTCFACPSQWEGRIADGTRYYVRYRWGILSVGLGETISEAVEDKTFVETVGDSLDGFMDWNEVLNNIHT